MSAVHSCLFNISAGTLHIAGRYSIHNLRTRYAVVIETNLSRAYIVYKLRLFIYFYFTLLLNTFREERRLRVFENGVLRRIFGPKRDEVTGEWRKLHNEERKVLYSSPNIVRVIKSRRMRWAGHVARMGEGRGVCRVLVGKLEGKRPLGRPRRRWEGG